jgi:type I restriction enzyme S subunit
MSWKLVKLTDYCRPKQWKTLSKEDLKKDGFAVYGANGKIGFYDSYTHEVPTLMISCRGANCGSLHISEPKSYINGNAMALDNLSTEFNNNFLFYYFLRRGFEDIISGSAQPQITGQGLSKIQIPLASIKVQEHIAKILDKADALRKKDAQLLQYYIDLAQSLFIDMFGDPVRNEKMWKTGIIRDLCLEVKYGTSKPAMKDGESIYLRMNNITYSGEWDFTDLKYISLDKAEKNKYTIKKGDLIFNRTNSKELVGKTAVYDRHEEMAIAGYLIRVRTNDRANPQYISAFLNSKYGKAVLKNLCKNIIGMANINAQELQNITIPIPPIDIQNQFVERIQNIEQQKAKAKKQLQESENLFQALLQKAFNGGLN